MTSSLLIIGGSGCIIVFAGLAAAFTASGKKTLPKTESPKNNWKTAGLWFSLSLEILFWISFLSSLLEKIGSPLLGNIIWLLSGILGTVFGIINLFSRQRRYIKVLSFIALSMGIILIPLWVLAMLIASM
jgi:hypothetical protein